MVKWLARWLRRHGFVSVSDTFSENPMFKISSLSIHPLKGNHVSLSRAAWESTIKNAIPWSQMNIQYGLRPKLVLCKLCTAHLPLKRAKTFARIQTNDLLIMSLVFGNGATSAGNNIPTFKNLTIFLPISIWADLMRGYQLLIFNLFQKSFIHHFSLAAILLSVIWKTCFMQSRWIKNALPGLLQCIQYTREAVNWNTRTERE